MTLPNFIIGGAAKCASTSLHAYLDEHPEVAMSRPKQTHFWDTDTLYSRGLEHYATYFAHVTDEKAVGETTPSYMHGRYIAERIKAGIPDIRMIFIFRDPVKRAYSNYWHGYRKGRVVGSFADTLDNPDCRHFWERGRYAKFLEDCFDVFGRERCQIDLIRYVRAAREEPGLWTEHDFLAWSGYTFEDAGWQSHITKQGFTAQAYMSAESQEARDAFVDKRSADFSKTKSE